MLLVTRREARRVEHSCDRFVLWNRRCFLLGLQQAGIEVVAGIDLERRCKYPYEHNLNAQFIEASVVDVTAEMLDQLWGEGTLRLLAGCAPCQPFSSQRRGKDPSQDKNWRLLDEFGRLVRETRPDYVTMENVPLLARDAMFKTFRADT